MTRKLLVSLAGIVLAVTGGAWLILHLSIATPGGDWEVDGLADALEVRFDGNLRPHVVATDLNDALFAEGRLHARYRLWQMELLRRAGTGQEPVARRRPPGKSMGQ